MEELAEGMIKAQRGEITLTEVHDLAFLAGMHLAINRVLYYLLAGSTLEEAEQQTRSYCRQFLAGLRAVDADLETWQAITGDEARA